MAGKPALTSWVVARTSSSGSEGNSKLTGAKRFALVDGFGFEDVSAPPSGGGILHYYGLIKN